MFKASSVPLVTLPTALREFGKPSEYSVDLGKCENCAVSTLALETIRNPEAGLLRDHWNPQDSVLRQKLAALHGVESDQVFVVSGGMAGIKYAFDVFAQSGTKVGILQPDFPFFRYYAHRVKTDIAELRNSVFPFKHEVEDIIRFVQDGGRDMLIISSPSAATGARKSVSEVEEIVKSLPETMIVVDEADALDAESAAELTLRYDNLMILRSFSKFYGLAGLRIGYIVVPAKHTEHFDRMIDILEVTSLAVLAARAVLDDANYQKETQERTAKSRAMMEEACIGTPYQVAPGTSCFACYIWAPEGVEDPRDLLARYGIHIADGQKCFGISRGGRINLSNPDEVLLAAKVIKSTKK